MKWLYSLVTKNILLTLIPIGYSCLIPLTFVDVIGKNETLKTVFWLVSGLLILTHIILLVVYNKYESKREYDIQENDDLRTEREALKDYIGFLNKVVLDNTNRIYDLIQKRKSHSDVAVWDWLENKGDEVCSVIYNLIHNIYGRDIKLTVNIMFKQKKDGQNGYRMLSRKSDDNHTPQSYRTFTPNEKAEGFYYKTVIDGKSTQADILIDRTEIEKKFKDNDAINYSQYIAVPIACKGNKIIGVIQILTYDNTIISNNREELKRLCNDYLYMASTLMLLSDKYENLEQIFN